MPLPFASPDCATTVLGACIRADDSTACTMLNRGSEKCDYYSTGDTENVSPAGYVSVTMTFGLATHEIDVETFQTGGTEFCRKSMEHV